MAAVNKIVDEVYDLASSLKNTGYKSAKQLEQEQAEQELKNRLTNISESMGLSGSFKESTITTDEAKRLVTQDKIKQQQEQLEREQQLQAQAEKIAQDMDLSGEVSVSRPNAENNTASTKNIDNESSNIETSPDKPQSGGEASTSKISGSSGTLNLNELGQTGLSALDKAAKTKGRAGNYSYNRITNEFQEVIAQMQQVRNDIINGKASSKDLQKLMNKYGKTDEEVKQYFINQIERGPSTMDYIYGYKVPQAITGVTLLGGMISMALGNNKGQKTNAELYSNPF